MIGPLHWNGSERLIATFEPPLDGWNESEAAKLGG